MQRRGIIWRREGLIHATGSAGLPGLRRGWEVSGISVNRRAWFPRNMVFAGYAGEVLLEVSHWAMIWRLLSVDMVGDTVAGGRGVFIVFLAQVELILSCPVITGLDHGAHRRDVRMTIAPTVLFDSSNESQ